MFYKSGLLADKTPFQFSTKYLDNETQLYYYGLRYYNPTDGRWINRDPIAERGGFNIYCFIKNSTVDKFDALGLTELRSDISHKVKVFPNEDGKGGTIIFSGTFTRSRKVSTMRYMFTPDGYATWIEDDYITDRVRYQTVVRYYCRKLDNNTITMGFITASEESNNAEDLDAGIGAGIPIPKIPKLKASVSFKGTNTINFQYDNETTQADDKGSKGTMEVKISWIRDDAWFFKVPLVGSYDTKDDDYKTLDSHTNKAEVSCNCSAFAEKEGK